MICEKNAIVTGSTSGIGKAIAETLAGAGANVMLNGIESPKQVEEQLVEFRNKYAGKIEYSPADMSKPADIHAMVKHTEDMFGGVDILVNNAGIQHTAPTEAFPDAKWDAIIAINLSAVFHAIKAALPGMQQRDYGRIVNIASVHGLVASKNKAAYVTAKHGVVGLTKVVALENAEANITCNAICPGWVRTPLVEKQIEDKAHKEGISVEEAAKNLLGEKQPNLRFLEPENIGEMVVFLCGDAGSRMTGIPFPIDGGWLAQ